ncbi:myb/SANT-like DNA-binding domain-containing protein 3 isoform X2 [Orussus abietinus]|uniref:myb/SANT-like DNA-binding domain-containing protein 3 isoform X2 n=1 Tax=Orussus abietinus TaxID=222816 RepID=UPI000624FF37|nr:myb/SANT-like DNA-binding domain-containing protein 3 isoform X2 [Orussus abietinus]
MVKVTEDIVSMMATKKRGANFSHVEKQRLVEYVTLYKDIIENRKTDAASVRKKDECWNNVACRFNSDEVSQQRSVESLKMCWENLKKKTRKQFMDVHRDLYARGERRTLMEDDPICKRIKEIIKPTGRFNDRLDSGEMSQASEEQDKKNDFHNENDYIIEEVYTQLDDAESSESNIDLSKWSPKASKESDTKNAMIERKRKRQEDETTEVKEEKYEEDEEEEGIREIPSTLRLKRSRYEQNNLHKILASSKSTSASPRNKSITESVLSKYKLIEHLREDAKIKSQLEIDILKIQLEKEKIELAASKKKLLLYDRIIDGEIPVHIL